MTMISHNHRQPNLQQTLRKVLTAHSYKAGAGRVWQNYDPAGTLSGEGTEDCPTYSFGGGFPWGVNVQRSSKRCHELIVGTPNDGKIYTAFWIGDQKYPAHVGGSNVVATAPAEAWHGFRYHFKSKFTIDCDGWCAFFDWLLA